MRAPGSLPAVLSLALLCVGSCHHSGVVVGQPAAGGDTVSASSAPAAAGGGGENPSADVRVQTVPCTQVATTWPVFEGKPPDLSAPTLSVVRTDFRPKDARLFLDGRFVGRARYFNGKKGYLYLQPGKYRLECVLGGYRYEVFEIEARQNCRFDIQHRMTRASGEEVEVRGDPPGKGIPTQRVFSPLQTEPPPAKTEPSRGPDPSLRPDVSAVPSGFGSLKLKVRPAKASVFIDGELLATGREIELMVGPFSVAAGAHDLEVRAAGFATQKITVEIPAGVTKEYEFDLQETPHPTNPQETPD